MKLLILLSFLFFSCQSLKNSEEEPKSNLCPEPETVNVDRNNERDMMAMSQAKRTCSRAYSGCLVKFVKLRDFDYQATCGKR